MTHLPTARKLFISYSQTDSRWLDRLQTHLKPLERAGLIQRWDDTHVAAGQVRTELVKAALSEAQIAIILISAEFLASEQLATEELPIILDAAERGQMTVLPVLVSACLLDGVPRLAALRAVNAPERVLARLPPGEQEEVLKEVARVVMDRLDVPVDATVPTPLAELIDRMLLKAPETRPSITQLMTMLAMISKGLPTSDSTSAGRAAVAAGIRAAGVETGSEDALKPTLARPAKSEVYLGPREVRGLLAQYAPLNSDLDAFLIDYVPQVKRLFLPGMNRTAQLNLLLESVARGVLTTSLRRAFPGAFYHLLMVDKGPEEGRLYLLPCPGCVVIGRGLDADVVLPVENLKVSRRQAVLDISLEEMRVRNEGKHPFFVNGEAITTSIALKSTDHLEIGTTVLRLETVAGGGIGSSNPGGRAAPVDWTERTHSHTPEEQESTESKTRSMSHVQCGAAEAHLKRGLIEKAEYFMEEALITMRANAKAGDPDDEPDIEKALRILLRLAATTRKDSWFAWIFDYARLCKYKMPLPLIEELDAQVSACRPSIESQLIAYLRTIGDEAIGARLKKLLRS